MIKLHNLSKKIQEKTILNAINLEINQGEVVALIGESGGGKSTLLRILAGLEQHTQGELEIQGKVGMVLQDFQLFPHMTVQQNCAYMPKKILQQPKDIVEKKAEKYLAKMGILDKKNHYPHQLSGGQKQRVAIIRSLMAEPDILLLDEPTSALDPSMTNETAKLIQQLAQSNLTIILATHDMVFAEKVAQRIIALQSGAIVAADTELA